MYVSMSVYSLSFCRSRLMVVWMDEFSVRGDEMEWKGSLCV